MSAITELDAINEILVAAGEQPVSSLVTPSADIGIAQVILGSSKRNIIMQGIAGNTFNKTYTPDPGDGKIYVTQNLYSISVREQPYTDKSIQVSIINSALPILYNLTDDTDDFSDLTELKVSEIRDLDWDDIPSHIQVEIIGNAKQRYQMLVQGDQNVNRQLIMEMVDSQLAGRQMDSRIKNRSIIDPTINPIASILFRTSSPYNTGLYAVNRYWRY